MSSHLVDGVALPDHVSGDPGLELCNTRAGWGGPEPREYLTGDRALTLWAADVGLRPPPPRRVLARIAPDAGNGPNGATARAIRLREALYACALGRGTPSDWDEIARAATDARTRAVLRPDRDDAARRPAWQVQPAPEYTIEQGWPLAALDAAALAAEQLLCHRASTVSACPGPGCGWLFTEPRGRRRWCSMAVCGNRSKARRHASRRRSVAPPDDDARASSVEP